MGQMFGLLTGMDAANQGAYNQAFTPATADKVSAPGMTDQQNAAVGQQGNILGQQQQFANALGQQMQGQGPSVANAQLQQALQQQQAQGAATAASQRGVNPALAMRTAMEQQGQNTQAAAQASGIGRANEAMQARGMLGNTLQGMMGSQLQAQQLGTEQQQMGLQAQEANQAANLKAQAMTKQAGQQAAGKLYGGIEGYGDMISSIGSMGMAGGGVVKNYAAGGSTDPFYSDLSIPKDNEVPGSDKKDKDSGSNPLSSVGKILGGSGGGMGMMAMNQGGKARDFRSGGHVPGKAKVSGDSLKNDTVPAMLSPGELVIPRSKAGSPDAAAEFARALIMGKKKGRK